MLYSASMVRLSFVCCLAVRYRCIVVKRCKIGLRFRPVFRGVALWHCAKGPAPQRDLAL